MRVVLCTQLQGHDLMCVCVCVCVCARAHARVPSHSIMSNSLQPSEL